jgi:hypothetical protein
MDRDDQAHELAAAARSVKMMAGAALIVALTGPMWVPSILASLNFRSSADIAAEQNRQDILRVEQASTGTDQRLKAAEAAVAKLREDLGKMEQRMAAMRDSLSAGAAAELAAALRGPGAFAAELAALRAVATPPPDLADMLKAITPFAETGVPSGREVRQRFLYQVAAGGAPAQAGSALDWFRRTVLFTPAPVAASPDPNLLEAETLLRDNDVLGAMAAVRRIEAPRPEWLDVWLADAGARAAADAVMPRLEQWAPAKAAAR